MNSERDDSLNRREATFVWEPVPFRDKTNIRMIYLNFRRQLSRDYVFGNLVSGHSTVAVVAVTLRLEKNNKDQTIR